VHTSAKSAKVDLETSRGPEENNQGGAISAKEPPTPSWCQFGRRYGLVPWVSRWHQLAGSKVLPASSMAGVGVWVCVGGGGKGVYLLRRMPCAPNSPMPVLASWPTQRSMPYACAHGERMLSACAAQRPTRMPLAMVSDPNQPAVRISRPCEQHQMLTPHDAHDDPAHGRRRCVCVCVCVCVWRAAQRSTTHARQAVGGRGQHGARL
jgi:hypothetical protein